MTSDEHRDIHQRLDRHGEKLEQIIEALASHTAVCEPMQSRLEAISLSIYGNGRANELLRAAFADRREDVCLASKVGARPDQRLVDLVTT